MRFSQRMGLTPVRQALQVDSMDEGLRNSLWNLLKLGVWDSFLKWQHAYESLRVGRVFLRVWMNHFKNPVDTLTRIRGRDLKVIRDYFFACSWYEVYDLLEFIANDVDAPEIANECNRILERECAGYRFIGKLISQLDGLFVAESGGTVKWGLAFGAAVPHETTGFNGFFCYTIRIRALGE